MMGYQKEQGTSAGTFYDTTGTCPTIVGNADDVQTGTATYVEVATAPEPPPELKIHHYQVNDLYERLRRLAYQEAQKSHSRRRGRR